MHLAQSTIALSAALALSGCAMFGSGDAAPVTAAGGAAVYDQRWWADNKDRAEFVPGQGWAVPGAPGYFDDNGRPMDGGVQTASYEEAALPVFVDKEPEGLLGRMAPGYQYKKVKEKLGYANNVPRAKERFQAAERLYQQKDYAAAAKIYAEVPELWPDSSLEEQAMFLEGEAWFFADRYPKANDAYNALVKKYINTTYLDRVIQRQWSIARYWEQHYHAEPHWPTTPNMFDKTRHFFDTKGHAIKAYENIRLNDPTGPLADDALMATANLHFVTGRHADADYYYSELRREYPESDHQFQAHMLGLQCKLLIYQGPDYDGAPLVEAKKIADQLLTQFPTELGEERPRIVQVRQQIAASQAQRDWVVAEFYAGKSEYGSARHYYEQLIRDYPTTKLADAARERLGAFQGEPDVPPQKLEWLVDLLPSDKEAPAISAQPLDDDTTRR